MSQPVRVGSEVVVTGAPSLNRGDSQIVMFNDGGYAVFWSMPAPAGDASFTGVQGRFFDSSGAPVTGEILVNSATEQNQTAPDATLLANGNVLVTWQNEANAFASALRQTDVSAQIFTPTGQKVGGEFNIPANLDGGETLPEIVGLNNGSFAAVWFEAPFGLASSSISMKMRIMSADGLSGGADIDVVTINGVFGLDKFNVAKLDNGNILASWRQREGSNSNWVAHAKIFTPDGTPIGSTLTFGAGTPDERRLLISPVSGDRIAVVREVTGGTGTYSVQLYNIAGVAVSAVTTIGERGEIGGIVSRPDGGFIVAWTDPTPHAAGAADTTNNVMLRAFNADGTADGAAFPATTVVGASEGGINISNAVGSKFAAVWLDGDQNLRTQVFSNEPPVTHPGTSGPDSLVGAATNDHVSGGDGDDFLFGNSYNPDGTMKPNAGNDILDGGAGNDGLFAGDGDDTLRGGDGNDGIVGGGGDDVLEGGAGADFLFGGDFAADGSFKPGSGNDRLSGGDGNDGLWGQDGDDVIHGDAGDDVIFAGAGADVVNGGAGNDYVLAEEGDDTVAGGVGFDYLYGDTGADTFVFRKADSADWILDFSAAQGDKIRLEGFGYANFVAIPLVDLSTPGHPAVQLTVLNEANGTYDQLTIFGASLADLNAGNVILA